MLVDLLNCNLQFVCVQLCLVFMSLPHVIMDWSVISERNISWPYILAW